MDAGFEIFNIFLCQKTTFFLEPPYFRAGGPKKNFGISLKFLHRKIFSGSPPISVHLKIPSFLKSDATLIRMKLLGVGFVFANNDSVIE